MGHGDRSGKEYMRVLNRTVNGSEGLMTKAVGVYRQALQAHLPFLAHFHKCINKGGLGGGSPLA